MTLEILEPPRTNRLISLSTIKLYKEETSSEHDELFDRLIDFASSDMINFLGVNPIRSRVSQTLDSTLVETLYLARIPVEQGTLLIDLDGESITDWTLDTDNGHLYRQYGWTSAAPFTLTYYAGFLAPDQIADWSASTSIDSTSIRSWVRPSKHYLPLRFECTVSGTTGVTEPVWPTVIGATVLDGTCTWTARAARELPAFVQRWCYAEVLRADNDRKKIPGLASRSIEGVSQSYFATQTETVLHPSVMRGLRGWKRKLGLYGIG